MSTCKHLLSVVVLALTGLCTTQDAGAQNVLDGAFIKENTKTQRVIPYPHIRESDVMWQRRVWRTIDLREKINHTLYYPLEPINDRKSLFDVIKQALLVEGSITAYDVGPIAQDDEFRKALLANELREIFTKKDTVTVEDQDGNMVQQFVEQNLTSRDVKQYRLKEDWIFDKQRSKMDIRIIGIAPMKEVRGEDGEVRGYTPLFWLYYPELRYVLANWDVFNRENDAERRSFENVFWTRQFNSYITKWSNVYDRQIVDYKQGIDALLEGEEIKQALFEFEHDLWNF